MNKTDNELIAEFMGLKSFEDSRYGKLWPDPLGSTASQFDLKYSTSWDWLMPVVEKIEKLHSEKFHYDFKEIKEGHWPKDNEYMEVIAMPLATPINEVYEEVIKFIKWYNSQQPSITQDKQ